MNINSINNVPLPQPQQTFKGKPAQKFVQVITEQRPLSGYTKEYLLSKIKGLSKVVEQYGKPLRIAQLEGERLLVNVGNLTKVVDASTTRLDDIPKILRNMVKANAVAEEKGLQKGLEMIQTTKSANLGSSIRFMA